ncbi:hypothetical protein [Fusobacterium sp. PH5-44]|uniref:hypothetical protein n=1 Tax=unclassified Fusobacterium TaxID=2648384 RepID=UPI003D254F33
MKKFDLYVFIIVVLVGIFEFLLGIYIAISGKNIKNAEMIILVVLNALVLIYWFRDKKYTFGYYFLSNVCANIPMVFLSKIYLNSILKTTSFIYNIVITILFIIVHALVRSFSYQYFKNNSHVEYDSKYRISPEKTPKINLDNYGDDDYEEIEVVDDEIDDTNK